VGLTVGPEEAAGQFAAAGPSPAGAAPLAVDAVVGGHIHRSWVVAGPNGRFVLQRVNTEVFLDVDALQDNTVRIGDHLRARGVPSPCVIPTRGGQAWLRSEDGTAWRAFEYLEGRRPAEPVASAGDAREVGRAFGRFAAALAELPGPPLHTTIAGFHDLPSRWADFLAAEGAAAAERAGPAARERETVAAGAHLARALAGLPVRVAHGDAKAANVLVDPAGAEDPVVVDLDTSGPATLLVDAGDLIRSCAVRAAEDEVDLERVVLDEDLVEAVVGGWLDTLAAVLTASEVARVIEAGQAICWEQAVRFLTDHLAGDRYYPVSRPGHNLDRARTQLRLLEQLEAAHDRLQAAVARLWAGGR
jgi:aminoglycoside phosphotransferase (APT) family kinase protein